jgi:hypothetical protein
MNGLISSLVSVFLASNKYQNQQPLAKDEFSLVL